MASLFNLVAMTVSSAFGTSATIPLGAAATINGVTYLSFGSAGATNGTAVDYSILDTGNSEIGTATYSTSGVNFLTARTPTDSTNGGAAIAATSAAIILCSPRAETLGTVQSVGTGNSSQTGLTGGPITISGSLAVSLRTFTNSLAADVSLATIGTYFNGPSVTQDTAGVWFATGNITCNNTVGANNIYARLTDGTTIVDSGNQIITGANLRINIALSGIFTSPSSNIKIQAMDPGSTSSLIEFNRTGSSRDSTLSAFRIG